MKIVKKYSHEIVTVPMQMIWTQDKLSHFDTRFMDQKIDKKMELRLGAVIMYIGNESTLLGSCGKITSLSRNGTINVRVLPHLIPTKLVTVKKIIQKYLPQNVNNGVATVTTVTRVSSSSNNTGASGVMDTMTAMSLQNRQNAKEESLKKVNSLNTLSAEEKQQRLRQRQEIQRQRLDRWYSLADAASLLNIQKIVLKRVLECIFVISKNEKVQIGLRLFDFKRRLVVYGYTRIAKKFADCYVDPYQLNGDKSHEDMLRRRRMRRRRPRFVFEISHKALQIVTEYRSKFPGVFRIIQQKPSLVTFGSHHFAPDQIPTNFNPYIVSRVVGVSPSGLSSNFQNILDSVVMAESPLETTPMDEDQKKMSSENTPNTTPSGSTAGNLSGTVTPKDQTPGQQSQVQNEKKQDISGTVPVATPMSRLFSPRKARFLHDLENPNAANHKNATFYKWKPDLTAESEPSPVAATEQKVDESVLSIRDAFKAKIHAMAAAKNAENDSSSDDNDNGPHHHHHDANTENLEHSTLGAPRAGSIGNGGNKSNKRSCGLTGLSVDDMGLQYVVQVQEWLARLGMNELALISANSIVIPPEALKEIESEITRLYQQREVHTKTNHVVRLEKVPLHHVYAADPAVPWSPTPRRLWSLGDRCCSLRSDASVPFGSTGTVIGIHAEFLEVLMDNECICGTNLCHKVSDLKGVLLSYDTVVNISTSFQSYCHQDLIPIDAFPRSRRSFHSSFTNNSTSTYHHQRYRNYHYFGGPQGGNQRYHHPLGPNINGHSSAMGQYQRDRYFNNNTRLTTGSNRQPPPNGGGGRAMMKQDDRRRDASYPRHPPPPQHQNRSQQDGALGNQSRNPMARMQDNRNQHRTPPNHDENVDPPNRSRMSSIDGNNRGGGVHYHRTPPAQAIQTNDILQFQQFQQFLMQQPLYLPPDSHEKRECNLSLK